MHGAAKYSSRWRAVFHANVADTTVGGDPEVVEHAAELAGSACPLGVRRSLETGGRSGDDLLVTVVLLGSIEEVGDCQRNVLHQALHERRM